MKTTALAGCSRMKRSEIRERRCQLEKQFPDYAALHPGYEERTDGDA
ncbi:MAG TPA: hypothetical protein VKC66_14750 [Xanthobacteraceae bacterium]|nr:hypothetical protein [Xanthobacteraceae bacterium]